MSESTRELLSAYLDGELDGPEEAELEARLAADAPLRAELDDWRRTVARLFSLNETEPVEPPAEFRRRLMRRIRAERAGGEKDAYGILEWLKGIRWRVWGSVAAALVLIFVIGGGLLVGSASIFRGAASGGGSGLSSMNMQPAAPEIAMEDSAMLMPEYDFNEAAAAQAAADEVGASAAAPVQRQMIRSADVTLIVDDFGQSSDRLRSRVAEERGYIANEEASQREGVWRGSFQIRLPADRLDPFLETLEDMGNIENRSLYSEDVTMEYVDVQSRIQAMRVKEARLLELIGQSGALADLLAVESELAVTRGELESLEGRMRYLSNQVEYSTVYLQVRQKAVSADTIQGTGLFSVPGRVREAFVVSVNQVLVFLGNFIVWIGGALPYLAAAAVIVVLVWRFAQRKRKIKENG